MITITLLTEARLYKTVETTWWLFWTDCSDWNNQGKINYKDVVLCWHFHFLPFSQKVAPCVLKGNHSFVIVAVTKVSINQGRDRSVIVKIAILLGPVCTKQNFIFLAKKSVNRKPFLVWIVFFCQTRFLKCHQSSKMLSKDLEAHNFWSGNKRLCSLTAILCWVIFL